MLRSILAIAILVSPALLSAAEPDEAALQFFESKVRPVLADQCYSCHSAQAKKIKGQLRVDSLQALLKGGETGPAVVPGNVEKSLLIEAINYKNTDLQMPPKSKLTDQQIADMTEWVKRGAAWPKEKEVATGNAQTQKTAQKSTDAEWAWNPVKPQPAPAVKNAAWPKSPIDNYVLAKLEQKDLAPAAPADKRALIRRAYFDLIGLPPPPEKVEKFVSDTAPDAYAKIIDELLASPQFGERWGRHWLDLVRYGESRGHEFDFYVPNAYQYRDYVIRALNADLPYNQFVTEQIAGDLLPKPRMHPTENFNESIIGTAFWFLGEQVHSPVDIRQDEADRFDNMVDVTCKTFLGLTVACARCHDHKFDPIATKDYYSMFGFLQSSSYRLARFESMEQNKKVAQDLWKLRADSIPQVCRSVSQNMKPSLERLSDYLLASREAFQSAPAPAAAAAKDDVIFEDFEKGTYEGWEVTGTAFGKVPQTLETIATYQGRINAVGKFFVNSHNIRDGGDTAGGDAHVGTMLSRQFLVKHDYITMLVGGGAHKDRTCVNLRVDGKVVQTATGRGDNQMFPVQWDVRALAGKTAQIQIVDNETGPWGNIAVDQIVFTNKPGAVAENAPAGIPTKFHSEAFDKRIAEIATARKLDTEILSAWVDHLAEAEKNSNDPFHAWAKICIERKNADPATCAATIKSLADAATKHEAASGAMLRDVQVLVDYANPGDEGWLPDGESFGAAPAKPGDVRLSKDPAKPIESVCLYPAAEFDSLWQGLKLAPGAVNDPVGMGFEKAGKTIRTKTVPLPSGNVHILLRGTGHVYAAVDSHVLINGPLHGQIVKKFESKNGYQWHSMDLTRYIDHRAHFEFTAESPDFAVAMVVCGPNPPKFEITNPVLSKSLANSANAEALAKSYQQMMLDAAMRFEKGSMAAGENPTAYALFADWMVKHPKQLGGSIACDASKVFNEQQAKLISQIKWESRLTMAMMDGSGEDDYVMIRGNWKNKGETAPRRLVTSIAGENQPPITRGSGRLELAARMTDPKNPFVSRVMVNRLWHHLIGRGLVPSVDNFGALGERPSHPELLDYLADDFVKNGWSIKRMIREIMLSSTYQMSSTAGGKADEVDPDNRLLHRAFLRRLEGEIIRDEILAVSGRLDTKMFGPSIPIFLSDFMQGRGRPASGKVDGDGRRSIYLSIPRNFLSPMMMAFDMPIPFNTMGRRAVSNVPAQALILMNDPFVVEQAQVWAKKVLAENGLAPEQRIAKMYQAAFARTPSPQEVSAAREFLNKQGEALGIPADKRNDDVKVWTDLAHVLMNFKEFIFLN